MKLPSILHLKRSFALLLIWMLLLSCSLPFLTGPTAAPAAAPAQSTPAATTISGQPTLVSIQPTPAEGAASAETDPLDRLLTLRSIKFNLTAQRWDGTSRTIDVAIDSAGSMDVKSSLPPLDPKLLPKGFDPKRLTTSSEMLLVNGKAYQPDDQNPAWMTTPVDQNYLQTLSKQLHGSDGPAFWLNLLPEGSIQPAGPDTAGGFSANKYTVSGQVDGQTITGAIWFEPQADALVQAELHIPAALLSDPSKSLPGELKIMLNAQKADVSLISLPGAPTGQTTTTALPTAPTPGPSTGSGPLAIADSYPLPLAQGVIGQSLTASPGKVWVGSATGTVVEVDSLSGAIGQTILLTGVGTGVTNLHPIIKLGFDGQKIWALEGFGEKGADHLFAIDSGNVTNVHQWDLTQWNLDRDADHRGTALDFGFSPGKIWLKDQILDTQTFEEKYVGFIGAPYFAYDGKGWMWMTGVGPEDCDGLDFIKIDDPAKDNHQCRYPFLNHAKEGYSNVGDSSPLVLAGDRVWIAGAWSGTKPSYTLEAFSAGLDQVVQETKPLASVSLPDNPQKMKMLFAGKSLWLLWTSGDKLGYLYQLDPQTGATINTLDLVGDQGKAKGFPHDLATEGNNLWVLTTFQLLRIPLP